PCLEKRKVKLVLLEDAVAPGGGKRFGRDLRIVRDIAAWHRPGAAEAGGDRGSKRLRMAVTADEPEALKLVRAPPERGGRRQGGAPPCGDPEIALEQRKRNIVARLARIEGVEWDPRVDPVHAQRLVLEVVEGDEEADRIADQNRFMDRAAGEQALQTACEMVAAEHADAAPQWLRRRHQLFPADAEKAPGDGIDHTDAAGRQDLGEMGPQGRARAFLDVRQKVDLVCRLPFASQAGLLETPRGAPRCLCAAAAWLIAAPFLTGSFWQIRGAWGTATAPMQALCSRRPTPRARRARPAKTVAQDKDCAMPETRTE